MDERLRLLLLSVAMSGGLAACGGGGGDNGAGSSGASDSVSPPASVAVSAPQVLVQPQAIEVLDGASATFSVSANGTEPFSYQWRKNGANISGATDKSYSTSSLALGDSGASYDVVIANSVGSVTSASALLTVDSIPPAIASGPASVSAIVGQSVAFNVLATGSAPISYQWKRNGVAIPGATGASYTIASASLADSTSTYSVVVTNGAGASIGSQNAVLNVSAVAVVPAITTSPANLTVTAGQTATFNVIASGTAPLAYQWQRNGVDIPGATSSTYSLAGTVAADNGAGYRVRVSNSAGNVMSAAAVLTVQASSSHLAGHTWTVGQQLDSEDKSLLVTYGNAFGIDDAGRVTVVFTKFDGTRTALYATRGNPNPVGSVPTWTVSVPIDVKSGHSVSTLTYGSYFDVSVAPGGNAVAAWYNTEACTASTYNTTGTCHYMYVARYLASTGAWEEPVKVGDYPTTSTNVALGINDRGDVVVGRDGWVRSGTNGYSSRASVAWLTGGAGFSRKTFNDAPIPNYSVGLDAAGNILMAGEATQNGTTDLVAYRGTVSGGFGAQQILDTRGSAATLYRLAVGVNGQQVVVWKQNNGSANTLFAANSAGASSDFVVRDLDVHLAFYYGDNDLVVTDSGTSLLYLPWDYKRIRWDVSGDTVVDALPADPGSDFFASCRYARNGDFACVHANSGGWTVDGQWILYDSNLNLLVQARVDSSPGPDYVLGIRTPNKNVNYSAPLLSTSGIAFLTMQNSYDVLPSASLPAGDGRSGVLNLWGTFLK